MLKLLRGTKFECPLYKMLKTNAQTKLEETLQPKYEIFLEYLRSILKTNVSKITINEATRLGDIEREVFY